LIATQFKVEFYETSALSGINVEESFGSLVERIVDKIPEVPGERVNLEKKKKSPCCK